MILSCPLCGTRYLADMGLFTPAGRNVRCAKCGHVWFQVAPKSHVAASAKEPLTLEAIPEAPLNPSLTTGWRPQAPEDAEEIEEEPSPRGFGGTVVTLLGWVALILSLVALGDAGVRYREDIAALWPQTATLYSALGLRVNVRGLEFAGVSSQSQLEDGQPVLAVTGNVVNVSGRELAVPTIRVSLKDDEERELYHWTFDPGVVTLPPGARRGFATRLASPPREARRLQVRFVPSGE